MRNVKEERDAEAQLAAKTLRGTSEEHHHDLQAKGRASVMS
jgi:hypothetical protein